MHGFATLTFVKNYQIEKLHPKKKKKKEKLHNEWKIYIIIIKVENLKLYNGWKIKIKDEKLGTHSSSMQPSKNSKANCNSLVCYYQEMLGAQIWSQLWYIESISSLPK